MECKPPISLGLAILNGFQGCFGPKRAVLGQENAQLGRAPPNFAPVLWGATGEFLAHNLGLARAYLGSRMARLGKDMRRWDVAMAKTE